MKRLVGSLVVLGLCAAASARKPEDVFAGRILVGEAPFPTQAKSEGAFVEALKRQSKDRINENKEAKQWRVFYVAFFNKPLNDLEVTIKVFDVTAGASRLVDTFEQYLSSQNQRAYSSDVILKRGDGTSGYDPNSKVLMVIESRGQRLATATFYLLGEARKYKGKVDFSEDESK